MKSNSCTYTFNTTNTPIDYTSNVLTGVISDATFSFTKLPVSELSISDEGGNYLYKPQKDITTFELAKILHLFTVATSTASSFYGYKQYDYKGFMVEHGLERHFELKK